MKIRIASFNLENLPGDGEPSPRHDVLRPELVRLDADILCLQEIDAGKPGGGAPRALAGLDALISATPYAGFHRANTLRQDTGAPADKHNLVVLSRWPIAHARQLLNDLVAPPLFDVRTASPPLGPVPIMWDRPLLETAIQLPMGRRLHILNMHLKAPLAANIHGQKLAPFAWRSTSAWAEGYYISALKRSGQALEARMAADRIFDAEPDALLAVLGDFNATEHEVPFRILVASTEDTGNGRLTMRELVALEHDLPEHRRFTIIHAGRKQMLDHILVSRSLLSAFRTIEVHNEGLGDELVAYTLVEDSLVSYHAPVVATFELGDTGR